MDIFNGPPPIADDTLRYSLYFPSTDDASLPTLSTLILSFIHDLIPGHIWHRDAFELKLAQSNDTGEARKWLEGTMRVGDAVDDEWCVIWLLREISKKYDVVISAMDSDGQFLLIEAADALPSWVTPSNAENRVWIYRSHLHLIPLSYTSPAHTRSRHRPTRTTQGDSDDEADGAVGIEEWINVWDAIPIVRDPHVDTLASPKVQSSLWARISGYPELARQHVHRTLAVLPVPIAFALHRSPELVQRATETFYTRDALQLRAARKMVRFPPKPDVLVPVTMTRTAYAQIIGQRFGAPKVFGLCPSEEGSTEWRRWDIGMKIACGFEMLYQESKGRSAIGSTTESADAQIDALKRDSFYTQYISNLKSAGFFGTEIEGSAKWKTLERKAAEAYVNARRDDDASRPSFASLVESALSSFHPDISSIAAAPDATEDSDAWLNIDAQDLEDVLSKATAGREVVSADRVPESLGAKEEKVTQEAAERLQGLARKVEAFVEDDGDLEGARFADDINSDEELGEDEDMDDPSSDDNSTDSMDEDKRRVAMDKLVEGLDPSEYGKMPENYKNPAPLTDSALAERAETMPTEKQNVRPPEEEDEPVDMDTRYRRPLLARDKFDGVDSDDSDLDEAGQGLSEEEEGEDAPQVVGDLDVDPDMGEEEEDFLKFTRQTLGISDEMWAGILKEREDRGAFVPTAKANPSTVKVPLGPPLPTQTASDTRAPKKPTSASKVEHFFDETPKPLRPRAPQQRPAADANPELNSFEEVMRAMDEELSKVKGAQQKAKVDKKGKGKARAEPPPRQTSSVRLDEEDDDDDDVTSAMDAELRASLIKDDEGEEEEEPMDYKLIKNFLESFKSQGGLSGPVSGLAGRLDSGFAWPRDAAME